jgi:hypothetical protein
MRSKHPIVLLSFIAALTLSAILITVLTSSAKSGSLSFELIKLLVQFFLVGVLGVVISLLVQNYNRQRDREILINELRKAVLTNLIRAYSDTKKARRILMGNRLAKNSLPFKVYDQELRNIIDTQLALEILNHQITTSQRHFGENADEKIIANVEAMEKYLGEIIDEYKDCMTSFNNLPESLQLSSLPKLAATMGKENEASNFRKQFVTCYRKAVAEIRKQILD